MRTRRQLQANQSPTELGLGGLLAWLAIFGIALIYLEQLAGWPTLPKLPDQWPTWVSIQVWLASLLAGLTTMVPLAFYLAWMIRALTAASVAVQAAVDLLDADTHGAGWVRSLRQATNWLVLPPIRRAVDAPLSGLLLARVLVQPAMAVEASSRPTAEIVRLAPVGSPSVASSPFIDPGRGELAGPKSRLAFVRTNQRDPPTRC
jgi:hypothetical protein